MILNFYKQTDQRWFVDLPEWKGDKDDLEMVMGADTMLDILSQGENKISLYVSIEPFNNYQYILTLKEEIYDGGLYDLSSDNHNFEVWLCSVTKFVFNYLPKKIYLSKNYGKHYN